MRPVTHTLIAAVLILLAICLIPKKGALSNSPVACIYCGEKKPMARQDGARP